MKELNNQEKDEVIRLIDIDMTTIECSIYDICEDISKIGGNEDDPYDDKIAETMESKAEDIKQCIKNIEQYIRALRVRKNADGVEYCEKDREELQEMILDAENLEKK